MKRIVLVIILFVSLAVSAQSNSFIASNNKLVWENVFISNETNIPSLIARHTRLKITSFTATVYKGTGNDLRNTCPGASAFMKDDFSFDFEIEISDGKYRVTVSNLVFKKAKKKAGKKTAAETYFIKDGDIIINDVIATDLTCLDSYFNKIFTMTAVYKNRS